MSSCKKSELILPLNHPWQRTRCNMSKSLNQRCLLFSDSNNSSYESACNSPFTASTTSFNVIDYYPVVYVKYSTSSSQLEDNQGTASIIVDSNQTVKSIIKENYKIIIIDIVSESVLVSGKVRSWQQFTNTDVDINFSLIRNPYDYEKLLNLNFT